MLLTACYAASLLLLVCYCLLSLPGCFHGSLLPLRIHTLTHSSDGLSSSGAYVGVVRLCFSCSPITDVPDDG